MKNYSLYLTLLFLTAAPQVWAAQDANSQVNPNAVTVNRPASVSQPSSTTFDMNADPFEEMEKVQKGMNKIFRDSLRRVKNYQQSGKSFEPDADFLVQNGQYVLKVDLPGMQKDQINIEVAENSIVLSGERKTERQITDEKEGVTQFERSTGSFYRRMSLPADADTGKVQAKYENGVLEVSMPKLKAGTPEVIKVKVQ